MKKILVVEDELAYLNLLHVQLTKIGYKVIDAINGKDGLEKNKSESPDLILLDIRMPVMGGMTFLDTLRKEEKGIKTPVILLTNLEPNEEITSNVLRDQPLFYFVKSDTKLTDLLETISSLFDGDEPLDHRIPASLA